MCIATRSKKHISCRRLWNHFATSEFEDLKLPTEAAKNDMGQVWYTMSHSSHNHLIGIYWYYAIGCATVQGPMAQCSSYGNLLGPDPDAHLPLAKSDPRLKG
jgi:hypothetical protein